MLLIQDLHIHIQADLPFQILVAESPDIIVIFHVKGLVTFPRRTVPPDQAACLSLIKHGSTVSASQINPGFTFSTAFLASIQNSTGTRGATSQRYPSAILAH